MSDFELQDKFPELQPIGSPPALSTINGIGFGVYGARDFDEETGTHIKTHCFCILFIPVLAIRAYRVASAESGWYFIGREPLSLLARVWNALFVGGIATTIAIATWMSYTGTDDYHASQQMAKADTLVEEGKIGAAANIYAEVAMGETSYAVSAPKRIQSLLEGPAQKSAPAEMAKVIEAAVELNHYNRWIGMPDELIGQARKLSQNISKSDPRGALAFLDSVSSLVEEGKEFHHARRGLLERIVKEHPQDIEAISQLAVICELQGEFDKCETLLMPLADQLDNGEGARILGQILAQKGKYEQAHDLLSRYCQPRLEKLHDLERSYYDALESAQKAILEKLQNNEAPDSFYERYRQVGQDQQDAMVSEYLHAHLKDDLTIKKAQQAVADQTTVVPVALDLGIVLLRRAQDMPDPQQQKVELEKAEKTFLAIRSAAGESDQYRLFLGQVYYWLGKHEEGKSLFGELLEANQRNADMLVAVGQILREVGVIAQARDMAEEAYEKEDDPTKRQAAAHLRALMFEDIDDSILWLQRSNISNLDIKASLLTAQGNKAIQDGDGERGADFLRQSIDAYHAQTETATTLNNAALAYFSLYHVTNDRQVFLDGMKMMEKAVTLSPSDSILLFNATTYLRNNALRDIIGDSLDLKILKMGGSTDLLWFLYRNEDGHQKYVTQLKKHEGLKREQEYSNKVMLLAPKRPNSYQSAFSLAQYCNDEAALESLLQQIQRSDPDVESQRRRSLDYYLGKTDDALRKQINTAIPQYEEAMHKAEETSQDATFAVAASYLASSKMTLSLLGEEINHEEIVQLSLRAHRVAPSRATNAFYTSALLYRANRQLAKQIPAYAQFIAGSQRSLGPAYLIPFAAERDENLRQAILANADVQRAMQMVIDRKESTPQIGYAWEWAMLRFAHPEEAARIASVIEKDKLVTLENAIEIRLSPFSGTIACDANWLKLIAGKHEEGTAILRQCAERGVPLPELLQN